MSARRFPVDVEDGGGRPDWARAGSNRIDREDAVLSAARQLLRLE